MGCLCYLLRTCFLLNHSLAGVTDLQLRAYVRTFISVLILINMSKLPLSAFHHIFPHVSHMTLLYQAVVCLLQTWPTNITVFIKSCAAVHLWGFMCWARVRPEAPSSPGPITPDLSTQTNPTCCKGGCVSPHSTDPQQTGQRSIFFLETPLTLHAFLFFLLNPQFFGECFK